MKYLLLVYDIPGEWENVTEEQMAGLYEEYGAVAKHPATLGSAQLKPVDTAKTVRIKNGETLVTDGPFAETKEQLGGYYLVEAKNLDEAIEASARIPIGPHGSVEIRPIMVFDEEGRPS